jgi:hypothetical protein
MKETAQRRRSKKQIQDDKAAKVAREADIAAKLAQFEEMQRQIADLQQNAKNAKAVEDTMTGLINSGLVKQD